MLPVAKSKPSSRTWSQTAHLMRKYWIYYALFLPVLVYYIVFCYFPMPGIQIAFKDYSFKLGIWGSPWTDNFGFKHFIRFLSNGEFPRLLKNTLTFSLMNLLLGFPIPIIFALLLNEVKSERYKKTVQTLTYLPHFVSWVVAYALVSNFFSLNGLVNGVIAYFGGDKQMFLGNKELYKWFYWGVEVWKETGWCSIIFLAQLTRVDPGLHEAAMIDGATRLQRVWHINLPTIRPLITYQFVMCVGGLMGSNFSKTLVMMNDMVRKSAETIDYYVYYTGLLSVNQYSYSTAIGLFNAVIGLTLTIMANKASKLIDENGGIW